MEYQEVLDNLHKNDKLNEEGYSEYVGLLKNDNIDLKLKIIDLENKLQSEILKNKKEEAKNV